MYLLRLGRYAALKGNGSGIPKGGRIGSKSPMTHKIKINCVLAIYSVIYLLWDDLDEFLVGSGELL